MFSKMPWSISLLLLVSFPATFALPSPADISLPDFNDPTELPQSSSDTFTSFLPPEKVSQQSNPFSLESPDQIADPNASNLFATLPLAQDLPGFTEKTGDSLTNTPVQPENPKDSISVISENQLVAVAAPHSCTAKPAEKQIDWRKFPKIKFPWQSIPPPDPPPICPSDEDDDGCLPDEVRLCCAAIPYPKGYVVYHPSCVPCT